MIRKLEYLREPYGVKLVHENIRVCFYCKHFDINWCGLKNKRVYPSSTCENWCALE